MIHTSPENHSSTPKFRHLFWCLILFSVLYFTCYSYKNVFTYPTTSSTNITNITILTMSYHHLLINESDKNITFLYYRGVTSSRNSSYPFISGDTFRALADHVFDETRKDDCRSSQYGDIIFVKGDMFDRFFSQAYQFIDKPFVLLSHNSDRSAPDIHRMRLRDNKILAWYASNPDLRNHTKVFPIPIGLANPRWPSGNLNELQHAFANYRKPWLNRTTLLYVNFSPETNREERYIALTQAKTFRNVQIIDKKISFATYLQHLGNAKFVLSPPGNGLDCHRTWEALMMGAAPVVRSSALDPLFNKIPAVILSSWSNLTEKYLASQTFHSYDHSVPVVLYARYWREKLRKYRYN